MIVTFMAISHKAFASVVYYQAVQSNLFTPTHCSFDPVGSFIASANFTLNTSSEFQFYGKKSDGLDTALFLSTTNDSSGLLHDVVFNFPILGGFQTAFYTGTDSLSMGTTYYFIAFSCNGSTAQYGTDGIDPTGVIDTSTITTPLVDTSTHIINLSPLNDTIATSTGTGTTTIEISLHAYINPDDMGAIKGVHIFFENIDQNIVFSKLLSIIGVGNSATIFSGNATSSGDFYFSKSFGLPDGNYRVHATLDRSYFGVPTGIAFFDQKSTQFIVGTSTWLGNIRQKSFAEADQFFGTLQATTSSAMALTCNPLSSTFGIRECLSFLLVPDSSSLDDTMTSFKDGFLVRAPWGYLTRVYNIMTASTTEALPAVSFTFGAGPLDGNTWNIDTGSMIASAGTLLDETKDRDGNNIRDVTESMIKMLVGIAVVFTIVMDLTGSHSHNGVGNKGKT